MAVTVERSAGDTTIRTFTIDIPDADLEDLRARIAATHWPERERVEDAAARATEPTRTTGASARRG